MQHYENLAREQGFTDAVLLEDLRLECSPELRAYCNPEQCPNYGKNWVCPPGCGTLEACREKLRNFRQGLLVRSVTDLTPPTPGAVYGELAAAHSTRLKALVSALGPGVKDMLVLTSGGCDLCGTCSYPDPCTRPKERMDSLSAFGIDVGGLCSLAGLPYSFREDRVYLTSLILLTPAEDDEMDIKGP